MPAPLKKHQDFDHVELENQQEPKFQDFQEVNHHSGKFQELVFFARLAVFSLMTVLFAFVLLTMNLAPIWAFLLSSIISYALTSLIARALKNVLS
ncbi:DUF3270 domain-containing protein [Streptococcus didelphis]|uniref:DUF3270 domain-containing protein n=1 Tax=Streptococcus didelphis TaxID=102886 RepID=A0ABY9LK15_9STRE|nr:DUF3270 domain-containing protein [Streptococcus didelphis]WMB28451.1 DUF3270 domain-containing protein [Streptococcus didelphis]WMB29127.1 DUF3270 domain-containing protein [Streptococcus didelphis]